MDGSLQINKNGDVMSKQEQLIPKKKRTFFQWVEIRGINNKTVKTSFTVPPHLPVLPCGCKKSLEDTPFLVKIENGDLVHCKINKKDFANCVLIKKSHSIVSQKNIKKEQRVYFS